MKLPKHAPKHDVMTRLCVMAGLVLGAPAWAASLSPTAAAQPALDVANLSQETAPAAEWVAPGSTALVPLVGADSSADLVAHATVDAAPIAEGGGVSVDDISFVAQATETGRKEIQAARDALPQLKDPDLRKVAEELAHDHTEANSRLAEIAHSKGWPVPALQNASPPPAGTASPDFDANWTDDMVHGHERSVSLYRAQAQGGEDKQLRDFARSTLPTIEQHLETLRRLQK